MSRDDDDDAPEDVIEDYDGETNAAGRPHGNGCARYADGTDYEGAFVDGARSGRGTMWLAEDEDHDSDDEVPRAFYLGEWRDDRPHGRGRRCRAIERCCREGSSAGRCEGRRVCRGRIRGGSISVCTRASSATTARSGAWGRRATEAAGD